MLLLGLDTATPTVSVAVGDGERVLAHLDLRPGGSASGLGLGPGGSASGLGLGPGGSAGRDLGPGGSAGRDLRPGGSAGRDRGPGGAGGRRSASPRHGELLAPAMRDVLAEAGVTGADLTHVVCGVGPGPFTGVRVGVVTARVLGLALGVPVVGICTLDALAARAGGPCVAVVDARRREVYAAAYDAHGRRTWGPRVLRPADLADALGDAPRLAVGPGAHLYRDVLAASGLRVAAPADVDAAALVALAAARLTAGQPVPEAAAYAVSDADGDGRATLVPAGLLAPEPLYLRRPDAVPGAGVAARAAAAEARW